nr:hypothetical protein [uncultured Tolumonas sp.]
MTKDSPSNTILNLLTQLASLLVLAYGLGYYIGWHEADGYYEKLGIRWFVSLLTPYDLARKSIDFISIIFSSSLISFYLILNNKHEFLLKLQRIISFVSGFSLIIYSLRGFFDQYPKTLFELNKFNYYLIAIAIGIVISIVVTRFKEHDNKIDKASFFSMIYIFLFGSWLVPYCFGGYMAVRDITPSTTYLSKVKINNIEWRLVEATNEKALLVFLGKENIGNKFKVIETKDIETNP